METWVCLLLPVALASSVCVTLSRDETAVIDPGQYFSGEVADIEVKPVGEPKVTVVKPENPSVLFQVDTEESDWTFGPSVVVSNVQFFTVLYRLKVEVWKVNGDSVDRVCAVTATVGKVVPLQLPAAAGFVYWTKPDLQLFYLNLTSPACAEQPIQGVETKGAAFVTACSKNNLLLTVHSSSQRSTFTYYEIDYISLTAVKIAVEVPEGIEETVLDVLCTESFLFLVPTAVLSWNGKFFQSRTQLPASLGPDRALHYAGSPSFMCLRAAHGAAIATPNDYLIVPGALRVFLHRETLICIESIEPRLTVSLRVPSSPWQAPIMRSVLLHQDLQRIDDISWLSTPRYHPIYLLIKTGQRMLGLALALDSPLLTVSSHPVPYTFDLCALSIAQQSTCTAVTVVTLPYEPGQVAIDTCREEHSNDSTVSLKFPMHSRRLNEVIDLSGFVSGWNMKARLEFPSLPPYLSCAVVHSAEDFHQIQVGQGQVGTDRFLCALASKPMPAILSLRAGDVVESRQSYSAFLFNTSLSIRAAAASEQFYALYAEEGDQAYLLIWRNRDLEQHSLQAQGFISLRATDFHALILMESGLHIATMEGDHWQWIAGQYDGMWAGDGRLVLRTAGSFEFYELWGNTYIFRTRAAVFATITQFTLTHKNLLALHANSTLAIYHITDSDQLILRFSVEVGCPVSHLTASGHIAVYRCPSHLQVLLMDLSKKSLLHKAIATNSFPLAVELSDRDLFEVHEEDGEWKAVVIDLWVTQIRIEELRIMIAEWYNITGSIVLQGQLTVSGAYDFRRFCVNITVESHGTAITTYSQPPSDSTQPDCSTYIIEPWETAIRVKVSDFVQGQVMHISAESNSDLINAEISEAATIQHYVTFPWSYREVAVVPEIQTLFAIEDFTLITCKYECEGQKCGISSKHSVPLAELGLVIVKKLEVLITLGRFTYIRFLEIIRRTYGEISDVDWTICYDSERSDFTVISRHTHRSPTRKFYILPGSISVSFHILYYAAALEHCTVRAQAPMQCTEVVDPSLLLVEAVGGVQVSECWEVYAVTSSQRIVTMELCEKVALRGVASLAVDGAEYVQNFVIAGDKLLVSAERFSFIYSLSTLTLLSKEPLWMSRSTAYSAELWRVGSRLPARFLTQQQQAEMLLYDLSASPHSIITAKLPFTTFQFTGASCGFAIVNNTAILVSFSEVEVVLRRVDSALETTVGEVTLTARNEMSTVSVKVSVIVAGPSWPLPALAIGTVGIVCTLLLLYRAKKTQSVHRFDVEMIGLGSRI